MKAAKMFKEALDVLEKAEFRNEVTIQQAGYYSNGVSVDLQSKSFSNERLASFRLVEGPEKKFFLDWIARVGVGDANSRRMQLELTEDLIALADVWEKK